MQKFIKLIQNVLFLTLVAKYQGMLTDKIIMHDLGTIHEEEVENNLNNPAGEQLVSEQVQKKAVSFSVGPTKNLSKVYMSEENTLT